MASMTSPIEDIKIEVRRLRGLLGRLWSLAKSEKLDRKECLNVINDIDRSFSAIASYMKSWQENLSTLPSQEEATCANEYILYLDIGQKLISFGATLRVLKYTLEHPQSYKDEDIKKNIIDFYKGLDSKLIPLEKILELKRGLPLISELTSRFPQFTENWAIATVFLSAMEPAVKESLSKRGEKIEDESKENLSHSRGKGTEKEPKESFLEDVRKLFAILKKEGKHIGSLDEELPPAFRKLRNKVIHDGYSPTDEELRMVITYVMNFLELSLTS